MNSGDSGTNTGAKMGRTLEKARKERGLTLEQVEEATKIRTGYLRELERENFDVLPAVYVQGFLRTYASFLHLDAAAMVQEFKRRQASQKKPPYPLYVGPPQEDDTLDDILAAAGRTAKSQTATEEDRAEGAAPSLLPAGASWYLYLGSAVFLVLVIAAVALALNAARDSRPEVSQVREPLISQAPETSPPGAGKTARVQKPPQDDKKQGADEEKDKPHHSADPAAKDEAAGPAPQDFASATATATAVAEPENQKASAELEKATAEPEKVAAQPEKTTAEPPRSSPTSTQASEPAPQVGTAPPPSTPRPIAQPQSSPSSPSPTRQGGGDHATRVKVVVGGKDPVQLSGGPFDD